VWDIATDQALCSCCSQLCYYGPRKFRRGQRRRNHEHTSVRCPSHELRAASEPARQQYRPTACPCRLTSHYWRRLWLTTVSALGCSPVVFVVSWADFCLKADSRMYRAMTKLLSCTNLRRHSTVHWGLNNIKIPSSMLVSISV
jgi:hypothetical protein